jgi:hypothetical protein
MAGRRVIRHLHAFDLADRGAMLAVDAGELTQTYGRIWASARRKTAEVDVETRQFVRWHRERVLSAGWDRCVVVACVLRRNRTVGTAEGER